MMHAHNARCVRLSTSPCRAQMNHCRYCLIVDGRAWMKISRWPGQYYEMTTDAVNASQCALGSSSTDFCKLSDAQINSVVPCEPHSRVRAHKHTLALNAWYCTVAMVACPR